MAYGAPLARRDGGKALLADRSPRREQSKTRMDDVTTMTSTNGVSCFARLPRDASEASGEIEQVLARSANAMQMTLVERLRRARWALRRARRHAFSAVRR